MCHNVSAAQNHPKGQRLPRAKCGTATTTAQNNLYWFDFLIPSIKYLLYSLECSLSVKYINRFTAAFQPRAESCLLALKCLKPPKQQIESAEFLSQFSWSCPHLYEMWICQQDSASMQGRDLDNPSPAQLRMCGMWCGCIRIHYSTSPGLLPFFPWLWDFY